MFYEYSYYTVRVCYGVVGSCQVLYHLGGIPVLPFIHPVEEKSFDHDGGVYSSPTLGFEIVVPAGAVTQGDCVNVKFGVCAHGPFSIFDTFESFRITDFLCVFASAKFKKPVTVKMEHCLEMPEYRTTPEVMIVRSDFDILVEGLYNFSSKVGYPEISDSTSTLSFEVLEFCGLCALYFPQSSGHLERQGSSTDSSNGAARLVRQEALDDSLKPMHSYSPQSSIEESDDPNRTRTGSFHSPSCSCNHCTNTDEHKGSLKQTIGKVFSPVKKVMRRSKKRVQYSLLLFEPKSEDKCSGFQVTIYACLDCPGSLKVSSNSNS